MYIKQLFMFTFRKFVGFVGCLLGTPWILLIVYSRAKLKSNGVKASPCSRLFREDVSDEILSIYALPCISFKHILIDLTSFKHNIFTRVVHL
jgi:hypothetical protein